MNFVYLEKSSNWGSRYIRTSTDKAFNIWSLHYQKYLKELYLRFKDSCIKHKINNNLNYQEFCYFVYINSTKYLSPWI